MLRVSLFFLSALAAMPAAAADTMGEYRELTRVVKKRSDCLLAAKPDEIVVCGRKQENLRYRLPLPSSEPVVGSYGARSVAAERYRLMQDRAEGGSGSCTTVGPNGVAGCMVLRWKMEDEQNAGRRPGLIGRVLTYLDPDE
ncbi:MAG: hypothetical protein Q7J32_02505 [Sphingomonadaceae bacterium]|nr:hypothetical protein [Sphingomonadaceae bacterium]